MIKVMHWRLLGMLMMLTLGTALNGCATRGIAEFQLYSQAFDTQYEHGEVILDSLARAERTVVLRRIRHSSEIPDFNPDQAAYFVETVDPPITGSIRASLKSLKTYNDALGGLANGEAAEVLANRVGTLATNIAGAIAASQAALAGAAAIPGASKLVSESVQALQLAVPIIKEVATFASRCAFRKQLIATYPSMRDLLLALRNGTPAMFEVLKRARVQRGSLEEPSGISLDGQAALENERAMLAAWVILLDKTLVAMNAAVVAAMTEVPSADLASLAEASIELRVLAEQVKSLRARQ